METTNSRVTTDIGDRRTFLYLLLKRTAGALLGAFVARLFLQPVTLKASYLTGQVTTGPGGKIECDCAWDKHECGCVTN